MPKLTNAQCEQMALDAMSRACLELEKAWSYSPESINAYDYVLDQRAKLIQRMSGEPSTEELEAQDKRAKKKRSSPSSTAPQG